MAQTKKSGFDWDSNFRLYPYIDADMRAWFKDEVLGGDGVTARTAVFMGSRPARKAVEAILDKKRMFDSGMFCDLDPVLALTEDPRTREGCEYWNAHARFYDSCVGDFAQQGKVRAMRGDWIEEYVTSLPRWQKRQSIDNIFIDYGDASDREYRERVDLEARLKRLRKLKDGQKLFHLALCLPWGRWIDAWVRDMCHEIVIRDESGKPVLQDGKRQLVRVGDNQWSAGFLVGFHPVYECGGAAAAEALQGADPLERILEAHCKTHSDGYELTTIEGRLQVFYIGPKKMDDGRLRSHEGPVARLSKWKVAESRRPLTLAGLCADERVQMIRSMVESCKEILPRTIWGTSNGKPKRRVPGLGDVLAERIWVLYHAAQNTL